MIVRFIFDSLRIPAPSYLDIGAHHPSYLNNTFIFYQSGSKGVNIEPDPQLIAEFNKQRPRDTNLNIGIAEEKGELEFYLMSTRTLNTFSAEDARAATGDGRVKIDEIVRIPVVPINDVLIQHFPDNAPDFVSLDVEGLDLSILRSFNFSRWRPRVVCVETITYSDRHQGKKIPEIESALLERGYFVFADTHINTIFVDRNIW
jgi:FkbM family methyltransferase